MVILGYPYGMPFRLFIAEVKRTRPACQCGVISHPQLVVGALQVIQ